MVLLAFRDNIAAEDDPVDDRNAAVSRPRRWSGSVMWTGRGLGTVSRRDGGGQFVSGGLERHRRQDSRPSESIEQGVHHVVGEGQVLTQSSSLQRHVGEWAVTHEPQVAALFDGQLVRLEQHA